MSDAVCHNYAIMLSVIYPIVLSAVMFNVDMLSVMAPYKNTLAYYVSASVI